LTPQNKRCLVEVRPKEISLWLTCINNLTVVYRVQKLFVYENGVINRE